ncbi:anti-CBASS protein Acb1 family protein, partial [Helicobacter rodentium]|uniref:anti-CBASS protein Acb1 family protein n=1 Tax=Helicobacter rodentium TaxID=59617 RepID=UPI0026183CEA
TGDYDFNSFYDEFESMQKSVLEPILLKLYRNLALEYNSALESEINIEFNQLKDKDMLQEAQALNFILDSCLKGIEAGIITQEQALKIVKDNGFWVNVNFEKENTDLSEFESLGIENETQEL